MSGWTEDQERAAAKYLQEQTAIASFELCVTFVRGMVRAASQAPTVALDRTT